MTFDFYQMFITFPFRGLTRLSSVSFKEMYKMYWETRQDVYAQKIAMRVPQDNAMTSDIKAQLEKFWSKETDEMNMTFFLAKSGLKGQFNIAFRFEGNGYHPLAGTAIGIGSGNEGDIVIMKWLDKEKDEIIFERHRGGKNS